MRAIQPAARNAEDDPWLTGFPEAASPGRSDAPDRAAGEEVLDADLAHISPLEFGHIRPNGTYWFDRDLQAADGSQVFNGTRAARIEGVNVAYTALE